MLKLRVVTLEYRLQDKFLRSGNKEGEGYAQIGIEVELTKIPAPCSIRNRSLRK